MTKSTKSNKSPLHASRDSRVDRWRGQRDTKHGTQLDFDPGNEEDGAE